ncbi:MAG: DUF3617 domain-containing protein [Erythrobacter sp.]
MTNHLQSLVAGGIAATMLTVAAGTAVLWASETPVPLASGQWQITQAIETLEVPGLPAAMVERMARDPKNAAPRAFCLGAASGGARPDPALFHALGGDCAWESWEAAGGMLNARLACSPPAGAPGSASVSLSGTYTAQSFALRSETIGRSDTGELELRLVAVLAGEHGGACAS